VPYGGDMATNLRLCIALVFVLGCTNNEVDDNLSCPAGEPCAHTCEPGGAPCNITCAVGEPCSVVCDSQEVCNVVGPAASSMTVDCEGAPDCNVGCPAGACSVTHCTGACNVTCNNTGVATLHADGTATCP
jgi:hypothetical protein